MQDVFIKQEEKKTPGFSIGVTLSRKETKGQVGLEIEVEGTKFPKPPGMEGSHAPFPMPDMKYWSYVHDGSLRGADNAEYVLQRPIMFPLVEEALKELWDAFGKKKSTFDDSNRTSVHVHLNCQEFHLNRLTSLMALYFTFEEVLTEWCGDHRVGNLFCLRAKDAPAIVSQIRRFIKSDGKSELRDHLHYSGMNANALFKFGSLEWRTLRGCSDPEVILNWVNILRRLYELSAEFQDPRDVCAMFSSEGPVAFFDNVLGSMGQIVRKGVDFDNEKIAESMYEGIRLAQDICFCRNWDNFVPQTLSRDPFGRDAKKMMKKLSQMDGGLDIDAALASLNEYQGDIAMPMLSTSPGVVNTGIYTYSTGVGVFSGELPTGSSITMPFEPPPPEPDWWHHPDYEEE